MLIPKDAVTFKSHTPLHYGKIVPVMEGVKTIIILLGDLAWSAAARELYDKTRIPVVFLTAYADSVTLARALAALPFGYLVKPCGNAELNAAIAVALARHGQGGRPAWTRRSKLC